MRKSHGKRWSCPSDPKKRLTTTSPRSRTVGSWRRSIEERCTKMTKPVWDETSFKGNSIPPPSRRCERANRWTGAAAADLSRAGRFEAAGDHVEADAFEVGIGDDERAAFERLDLAAVLRGEVGRVAGKIDPEDLLEQQQHADDADDGGGISDGVSECGQREAVGRDAREAAERLRAGAERRRVRRGAEI